jgi:type IV pilus assembly protein PilOP
MKRVNFSMPQLDLHRPWLWPRTYQYALFVMSGVMGAALLSPWWLRSWQAWDEANEAKSKLMSQQELTQALRAKTAQLLQDQTQSQTSFADVSVFNQLAQEQGLKFSQVGLDKPQHSPAMTALQVQQLPVHLKVQGSWNSWINWLAQWSTAAPGVTVASLELKADPQGGISAHVVAVAPQSTATETEFELSSVNIDTASPSDPFSAIDWARAQRAHVQQHPSYARLVAPELLRPRDLLETFPRERLQYVGQIASRGEVEALIKVLPPHGVNKEVQMMSVHRVRVGSHLGHDFGKVQAVQTDHLVVQELALMPTGEWQIREVRLPLHEAAP